MHERSKSSKADEVLLIYLEHSHLITTNQFRGYFLNKVGKNLYNNLVVDSGHIFLLNMITIGHAHVTRMCIIKLYYSRSIIYRHLLNYFL